MSLNGLSLRNVKVTELGDKIRLHRKRLDLDQAGLAHKVGVGTSTISRIESGDVMPGFDTMIALAQIFGISLDELAGLKESASKLPAVVEFLEASKIIRKFFQELEHRDPMEQRLILSLAFGDPVPSGQPKPKPKNGKRSGAS